MKNKKIYYIVLVVLLLIFVVSTTYAFFAPQSGGTTSTNATVTSNTTDLLTFSINRDISFTVTQALFAENGENQSGDATATATLTPNNKTGAATMNYYLYLNIESNPTVYSEANTNRDPELMLQVFDSNNQLVTLTGLGTQKTIKGVTGYDITKVEGLIKLLDNHAINASNNTATIENWRVVITLINHDFNQNDNTGKTIEAEIITRQDEQTFTGIIYRNNTIAASIGSSIVPEAGTKWVITNGSTDIYFFDSESECNDTLNVYNNYYGLQVFEGYSCELKTGLFGGVGDYEISSNVIRSNTYDVYCPIGQDKLSCDNNWYYATLEQCEQDSATVGYTCTQGSIIKPYYLKHHVEDNNIQDAEACLWYNNHEFCLQPGYWVETGNGGSSHISNENKTATLNKLINDMETSLGIEIDDTYIYSNGVKCIFGDYYCTSIANGDVTCGDNIYNCGVSLNDGFGCLYYSD